MSRRVKVLARDINGVPVSITRYSSDDKSSYELDSPAPFQLTPESARKIAYGLNRYAGDILYAKAQVKP